MPRATTRVTTFAFLCVFAVIALLIGSITAAFAGPGRERGPKPDKGSERTGDATEGKGIPTRLRFHLDSHHVAEGESVTGTAQLLQRAEATDEGDAGTEEGGGEETRARHGRGHITPFADQTLHVFVDRTEVGTVTTDAEGLAAITATGEPGGHVLRVIYLGDDTHRGSKRAQGFHVGGAEEGEAEADCPADEGGGEEIRAFQRGPGGERGPRPPKPERPERTKCPEGEAEEGEADCPADEGGGEEIRAFQRGPGGGGEGGPGRGGRRPPKPDKQRCPDDKGEKGEDPEPAREEEEEEEEEKEDDEGEDTTDGDTGADDTTDDSVDDTTVTIE